MTSLARTDVLSTRAPASLPDYPTGRPPSSSRNPQETLTPVDTCELVRLLMVAFQYEITSWRLRIIGCTLDDLRTELRRREGVDEEAAR